MLCFHLRTEALVVTTVSFVYLSLGFRGFGLVLSQMDTGQAVSAISPCCSAQVFPHPNMLKGFCPNSFVLFSLLT